MDNDITSEQLDAMQTDLRNTAELYHITFGTDTGKEVLKHLKMMTSLSHLAPNNMMDAQASINPAEFMFLREGQNQVLRYIETLINYYKENA